MADSSDSIKWIDTGETIRDVVYKHKLPALVQVSEGYYSENDAETFSCGDLLKLDSMKTIMKVSARVGERMYGFGNINYNEIEWKDEILIPLGYKGKVQIIRMDDENTVCHSVKELIQDSPRFFRIEQPIIVTGGRGPYTILAGSELEFDRILPDRGLVCRYGNKEAVIGFDVTGKFVQIQDNTQYTLQEIIDRLSLPQCVKFVETEFQRIMTGNLEEALENLNNFSGILKIEKVVSQHVVVGHHKPADSFGENSQFCERSVVLLPIDSPVVNEIEVLIPESTDTEEYEIVLTRHFSENINMDLFDGGLYLELARKPHKVQRFSNGIKGTKEEDAPPPVPPRLTQKTNFADASKSVAAGGAYIDLKQTSDIKGNEYYGNQEICHLHESKVDKSETSINNLEDEQCEYDYPDFSQMEVKPKKKLFGFKKKKSVRGRPLPLAPYQPESNEIPVGTVQPQTSSVNTCEKSNFKDLTIQELSELFDKCGLTELSKFCEAEMLDGAFFNEMTESELKGEPFKLTTVQFLKVEKIKKGWKPKI